VIEEFRDGQDPIIHTIAGIDEYQCMVEHFADCALNGHIPRYSADEAALNMRVIEALCESSGTAGKPVTV
jgi:predicted dehydrogenase